MPQPLNSDTRATIESVENGYIMYLYRKDFSGAIEPRYVFRTTEELAEHIREYGLEKPQADK